MNTSSKLVPPGMVHVTRVQLVRGQSAVLAVGGDAASELHLCAVGPDGRTRSDRDATGFTARTSGMHLLRVVNAGLRAHHFQLQIDAPHRQPAMTAL